VLRLSLLLFAACGRVAFDPRGDANGGDGDGDNGDGPGAGACAKLAFSDTFDDGVVDPFWAPFADPGYTVAETNGALTITYAATVAGSQFAGYDQVSTMAIEGGCVRAQLVTIPDPATSAFAFIRLGTPTDKAFLGVGATRLRAQLYQNNQILHDTNTAYSSVAHQYLGFRIENGMVHWEASSDGSTWSELRAPVAASFDPATASIEIAAGTTSEPVTNAGTVRWDDLEVRAP